MTAHILVVDDEPDLEALILQKFRHQIREGTVAFLFAHDGVEALAALKANDGIDLVVTDINMPRMDGLSLLQKLQEGDEHISTIIVSAYGDMTNIRTAMNRGAFDFVTKPIDFTDFEATIAKTLRNLEVTRDRRLKIVPLLCNRRLLLLQLPVLFKELVEQHRVHLVVADGVGFSVLVHRDQGRVHPCYFFSYQAKLGRSALVVLVVERYWFK